MKKPVFSNQSLRQIKKLSEVARGKFEKQLSYLLKNINHPSLRAKKYDEVQDIWQARVDDYYRFYFQIRKDVYRILTIIKHPK